MAHSNNLLESVVVLLSSACIAVLVWALFLLGSVIGVQWYVSGVAILLIGQFLLAYFDR